MLIHAKNIIGMNVTEMTRLEKLSLVKDIVVDPDTGAILALVLEKNNFFSKPKIVSVRDIIEFYSDGILIKDRDSIISADEIIKVRDVLRKKILLLKSKVMTQKGRYLGRVDDFIFDTNLHFLVTIIAKKRLSKEKRIMSADRIMTILRGRVIIRDIIEKVMTVNEGKKKKVGVVAKPI